MLVYRCLIYFLTVNKYLRMIYIALLCMPTCGGVEEGCARGVRGEALIPNERPRIGHLEIGEATAKLCADLEPLCRILRSHK